MTIRTATYQRVIEQFQSLAADEQLRLLRDLAGLVQSSSPVVTPKPSLMDVQGLGNELWRDVDVDAYLNEERDSWKQNLSAESRTHLEEEFENYAVDHPKK